MAAVLTYPYKVLAKGYEITGDVAAGYGATVPYLVAWGDAFAFADQLMGLSSAATVGPITWKAPYRFPAATANLYVQRVDIKPCGVDPVGNPIPLNGLAPGEFFSHAIVTAEFGTPSQNQLSTDDPGNRNQLDPDNPITMCTQSVRSAGKMQTIKNGSYLYDDDLKPVPGDFAVPTTESKLVLAFPRVPYLPWQLVRPYINTLNSVAMLGVGIGELLFEDMNTRVEPGPNGLQQSIEFTFAVTDEPGVDWNWLPKPNGTPQPVRRAADKTAPTPRRIYAYKDFRAVFNQITYNEA